MTSCIQSIKTELIYAVKLYTTEVMRKKMCQQYLHSQKIVPLFCH